MKNLSNKSIDKETDIFLLQNKLLFKKFQPIKAIGKGTFSTVYLSINIKTNEYVAIKAEKRTQKDLELLESEAFLLYSLRGFGIPEVISYGRTKTHNILVMPLLGNSLLDLFIIKNEPPNISDICNASIQILDRIEWVHFNNIVYRDVKPENFLFGKKDNDILYLIDFGLCRKYKSPKTGKHIIPKNLGKFTGTSRYASVYAMAGNEQSRRDDIESIGYMIIFFMKKKLPWQGIKGNSYKECYHKLYLMKKHMKLEDLCRGLPSEMIDYMNNAKSLKFDQQPNYKYLKNLFNLILRKKNTSFDTYILSWCRANRKNSTSKEMNKRRNDFIKMERNSTPQNLVNKRLKENIENKNKSIPNISLKHIEISEKNRINTMNCYDNSIPTKNEIIAEISDTNRVFLNKNINSIKSGLNEEARINLSRINSEKNVYKNNLFSFKLNNTLRNNLSPDNKVNHYLPFNQDLSSTKNLNENNLINKDNNDTLKKLNMQNPAYKACMDRRIIKISPIPNDRRNNRANHSENKNINIRQNKNRITKIKIFNNKTRNNENNKENFPKKENTDEKIIYNSYNTYNLYDSTEKKVINNINNNIYHRKLDEIQNYQNYTRIKKIDDNKNTMPTFPNLKNYAKIGSFNLNNSKSPKNIIKPNPISITQHFSCKIPKNFPDNMNDKSNLKKNKSLNKLLANNSNQILGYNEKVNKINNNNSHIVKNKTQTIIHNINNNSISNIKRGINSSINRINREEINNISTPKFLNNTEERINKNNSNIHYGENNLLKQIFNLKKSVKDSSKNKTLNKDIQLDKNKNNSLNSIEKEGAGLKKNILFNNKIYRKIPKDAYYSLNNSNRITSPNSIQNLINNRQPFKKPPTTYIYKSKKGSNSIIIYNNNHNIYLSSNNSLRNIDQNHNNNLDHIDYYNIGGISYKFKKNISQYFNKIEPKIVSNHSLKVINSSNSSKRNNYSQNVSIKKYLNEKKYNNNYFENRYKTEEIDNHHGENVKLRNAINRINKYKIARNRGIQNN